jgi:lysophospholipase L1-like esterase
VGNDVVINDPQVSRRHASLTWDGSHFIIQDLGSANGTFVNGVRISEPHTLKDGDLLGLGGRVELAFRAAVPVASNKMPTMAGVAAPISGEPVPPPAPVLPPEPPGGEPAEPASAKRRNVIMLSVAALLGLCFILSAIGGLAYFFWPQEKPTPIIIVATLTPTTPSPPVLTPEDKPTPTATPSAQATVSPSPPETVSAPGQPPPSGTILWPIDAAMKAHLRQIMQIGQAKGKRINVFAKVGDSITESMAFLNDYCCGWYDLGPHTELEEVIQYFAAAHADELEAQANPYHTSFDRMSLAVESGAHAAYMLEGGADSSLMQEVNTIQPGLAIIMFGTNEALAGEDIATYKANLKQIVTILKGEGIIPILSTVPDLVPPAEGGERIPALNQAIKEVALEEQVPLMDFWQALQPLPNKGLDADGIHPNVLMVGDEYHSADLTPEGLQYGFNVRNKLALEMLAKVKTSVIDDGPPDAGGPTLAVPPTEPPVSPTEPPATSIPPTPTATSPSISVDTGAPAQLIQPTDLVYLGAFRLPDGPEGIGWGYSGTAMTYYPDGEPNGPTDGYPGSIFGTGHNWNQYVSEISIPVPIISPGKNVGELNTATTLQDFQNIRGNLFAEFEIPRAGLEYLPAQGEQTTGKLYFCWAQHMGEGETNPSHGWCELDLSNPQAAGAWRIGDYWNYVTTDSIFAIPQAWADANTPGMYLATGRFRDGGQGAQGPSLFAYGPWNEGNPPPPDSTLSAVPLLLYGNIYTPGSPTMNNYHHSDEWAGGTWLTAGDKSAIIFVGTKGTGDCWYGCSDGTVWPDEPPYPPECPERGWWSTGFVGQIIFYDPADLAAVVRGEMETWEPQPYATLEIDEYLYHVQSTQQWHHVGAASFDRERGLLYVFEPLADGDKSLIHVWRVEG